MPDKATDSPEYSLESDDAILAAALYLAAQALALLLADKIEGVTLPGGSAARTDIARRRMEMLHLMYQRYPLQAAMYDAQNEKVQELLVEGVDIDAAMEKGMEAAMERGRRMAH